MFTEKEYVEFFDKRRCSNCGKHELISYFPFVARTPGVRPYQIEQEIECENCGWYFNYKYDIANIKVIKQ